MERVSVSEKWLSSDVLTLPFSLSVPHILGPIVACLENLERMCDEDDGIKTMVKDGFGGLDKLRKDILFDFFRNAFDGSGADNFYDAGESRRLDVTEN